jgi:hypothetical protein
MNDLQIEKVQRLFSQYEAAKRSVRERLGSLLESSCPLLDKQKEQRKLEASRFNLFDALGVTRRELTHSAFLAYFLNPKAHHDQGDVFLRNFLKTFLQSTRLHELNTLERAAVWTERVCNSNIQEVSYGRVDIAIQIPDVRVFVVIENKLDAGEQDEQIPRYQTWMEEQPKPLLGYCHQLLFLTPDGRRPTEYINGSLVGLQPISYVELSSWMRDLKDLPTLPVKLRETFNMYANVCAQIGGMPC